MAIIEGFEKDLEVRMDTVREDVREWTVEELKNEQLRVAMKNPDALRPLDEIPRQSYADHARYQRVYEKGKSRYINFQIAHDYLKGWLLSD